MCSLIYTLIKSGDAFSVFAVALLAEGVDRNADFSKLLQCSIPSPSSRRAWIEIRVLHISAVTAGVALLAEGVDRNDKLFDLEHSDAKSPSSRRAWIEISSISSLSA